MKFQPEYPAIVLENPKFPRNCSAVIRVASCFDVKQVWYTGDRMDRMLSGMKRLPREERMKGYNTVKFIGYDRPLDYLKGEPIVVEFDEGYMPLTYFTHPLNAVYIFGPEDGGVSKGFRSLAHHFVTIPSRHCLNLATAVSVVISHRTMQMGWMPDELLSWVVPVDFADDVELG